MSVIQWDNDLCIGHDLIDTQHKRLFELTTKLYDIALGSGDKANLKLLLLDLYKYTLFHFDEEEVLMRKHNFPHYNDHKHEHEKFVATLDALAIKAREDTSALDIEILNWLSSWLVTHISIKDKMIGQCLSRDS
ncbi:bacteriohemerythrin [Solidesulfovibrio magneticus]|uniref:Hemerythrin family protein n=1 Tax=Solidesulfovibrio magneticus (strain ATCC 700980 / DSM 13731 / RS-1) TaxID=573370 RepID=C4XJ33_SOLM1|nr:bacteriohemerythrin [Solidesulfovibrio magneticus]BAH74197.1 hemerythrin family protein [Solidesulfovibrio magneticus RS-1]